MKYTVVIERTSNNYAVYVPDLPGCVATAGTRKEVLKEIREAIEFHIEGMRADGEPVPEPSHHGGSGGCRRHGSGVRSLQKSRSYRRETVNVDELIRLLATQPNGLTVSPPNAADMVEALILRGVLN